MLKQQVSTRWSAPSWARLERALIDTLNEAALEFVQRYARNDGTLRWRTEWPGMDGSDDPYEGFQNFPLLYALGGSEDVDRIARFLWESITWQWTEYGQIYREFDAYYDWMHHGEGSLLFYFFALADPSTLKDRQRALRFANFYTGHDEETPNYDIEKKMMRAPINGSRGPRWVHTAEDWCTHRDVLDHYPPPFEDIPGVDGPTCPWSDDAVYAAILERINQRMARGDVPLNLISTSLVAHAYLYMGDDRYRQHVLDYLAAWMTRAEANGGILPDNIGPSGEIGECMDGKWWGGYYGWRWPHGAFNLIEASLIAGSNALLLDGKPGHLQLVRSQLDLLGDLGREENGQWMVPHKHGDAGWYQYQSMNPTYPIYIWYLTMDREDARRIDRLVSDLEYPMEPTARVGKGNIGNTAPWYQYITGKNPGYPEQILLKNFELVAERMRQIRADDTAPDTWDIHHWQELNPVVCEGLVQLTMGAPMHIYHGGLLHAVLRYYDADQQRPGLPSDVGALVENIDDDSVTVQLVNLDPIRQHNIIVQSGAFGEHRIESITLRDENGDLVQSAKVGAKWVQLDIDPASGIRAELKLSRYVNQPSYETPFCERDAYSALIQPRRV